MRNAGQVVVEARTNGRSQANHGLRALDRLVRQRGSPGAPRFEIDERAPLRVADKRVRRPYTSLRWGIRSVRSIETSWRNGFPAPACPNRGSAPPTPGSSAAHTGFDSRLCGRSIRSGQPHPHNERITSPRKKARREACIAPARYRKTPCRAQVGTEKRSDACFNVPPTDRSRTKVRHGGSYFRLPHSRKR